MESSESKEQYILAYNLDLRNQVIKLNAKIDKKMKEDSKIRRFTVKVNNRDEIINNFKNKLKAVEAIKSKKSLQ